MELSHRPPNLLYFLDSLWDGRIVTVEFLTESLLQQGQSLRYVNNVAHKQESLLCYHTCCASLFMLFVVNITLGNANSFY